ncbi:MAG: PCRF domain-containing protein, partial [Thermosulfidibacteraceae bacterium]
MSNPSFWNDVGKMASTMKLKKQLESMIEEWERVKSKCDDVATLIELAEEELDATMAGEIRKELGELKKMVKDLEIKNLLKGDKDVNNAIVTINPGTGGTEAQDWAEMLLRMYTLWAKKKGFEVEIMDWQPADDAGIKSVTFLVKGPYAYGYLKGESGVHRLVRISPFDANKRRHTSFASVFV